MMEQKKSILVLDGNSSQCLPLIRAFYKDGHRVSLVCPGICSSGYFSRYVNKKLIWPKITGNEKRFYQIFFDHIQKKDYDLVFGLSDVSTAMLAYHKSDIEKYVQTVVPDYKIYEQAADKYLTMQLCMRNKIPCPLTFNDKEISEENFKEKLKYPIVVKPQKGVGSVGFTIVPDRMSLLNQLPLLKNEFGSLIIQEYIPNRKQYTAEVICDRKSEVKACVISEKKRFFPILGGTSSCNETINCPEIRQIAEKLLKVIKWTGIANVDFVLDPRDNIPKVIEINPRIGATVKIAFLAGINFSRMLLSLSRSEVIPPATEYKKGIVMRNLLLDLFWFLFSTMKQKRITRPAYFKFVGRNIYYQSFQLDDPAPLLGFVMGYLVKYSNIKKLKSKLNLK